MWSCDARVLLDAPGRAVFDAICTEAQRRCKDERRHRLKGNASLLVNGFAHFGTRKMPMIHVLGQLSREAPRIARQRAPVVVFDFKQSGGRKIAHRAVHGLALAHGVENIEEEVLSSPVPRQNVRKCR